MAGCLVAAMAAMPATSQAQKRQRDVITRAEIMASAHKELDLYQVVRSLRPHFLQPRPGVRTLGNSSIAPIAVYVDRKRDIGLEALRTIRPDLVEEVRYLDPSRSGNEFGVTASGGAVLVKLYKAPRIPQMIDTTPPLSH